MHQAKDKSKKDRFSDMKKIVIAKKLKAFRREKNITQKQLGDVIGVSAQCISKWEREDCYPDITVLPIIADAIGCTVNEFFA